VRTLRRRIPFARHGAIEFPNPGGVVDTSIHGYHIIPMLTGEGIKASFDESIVIGGKVHTVQ